MLAGNANKSTGYTIECHRRIVYPALTRTHTQNTRWSVRCYSDTVKLAQCTAPSRSSREVGRQKKAVQTTTSQIKCSMFAIANATAACWGGGGRGLRIGGREIYAVCVQCAWRGSLIKHNLRFNASMFGPAIYRGWLIHRLVFGRCWLLASCIRPLVICRCCFFCSQRFALILFELI